MGGPNNVKKILFAEWHLKAFTGKSSIKNGSKQPYRLHKTKVKYVSPVKNDDTRQKYAKRAVVSVKLALWE